MYTASRLIRCPKPLQAGLPLPPPVSHVLYNPTTSVLALWLRSWFSFALFVLSVPLSWTSSLSLSPLPLSLSLLSWPCLVYSLPLLWILPDASGSPLRHIDTKTLLLNRTLEHSCLYFIRGGRRVLWLSEVNVFKNHQSIVKKEILGSHRFPSSSSRRSPGKCTLKKLELMSVIQRHTA